MGENEKSSFPRLSLGLRPEEISAIQGVCLNYRYNFAEPPYPKIHWTLLDLIAHARFPMCRTDVCDKWNYRDITVENFSLVIDVDRVSEPGFVSARTVSKVISYCLLIAESTAESIPVLSGKDELFADTILAAIADHRDQFGQSLGENNPWAQFYVAVRHPVVRWGINNALLNRWGTAEYPPVLV